MSDRVLPMSVSGDPESLLRGLRAVGEDGRRCIRLELDGTGDVVSVEVTSEAKEGNREKLETSIREALVAVTAALRDERARHADELAAAATTQLGDLGAVFRDLQTQADARMDEALTKIAAAADRVGR